MSFTKILEDKGLGSISRTEKVKDCLVEVFMILKRTNGIDFRKKCIVMTSRELRTVSGISGWKLQAKGG